MNEWVEFYRKVLGFKQLVSFDDKDICTEYSALMSKVVQNGTGRIKFPINEPAQGEAPQPDRRVPAVLRRPGRAAHRARSPATSSRRCGRCGPTTCRSCACRRPTTTRCPTASGRSRRDIDELADLGILVDRDDEGYMLQIFTKPVADRPTLFFEVIQRRGSKSFGKGNFKALFEAIEREQALRGTL